jgi:mRNA interferase MazF
VRRGEIWWYEPPDEKRRPVLILTRDEAIGHLNRLIAVPITRTIRGIETEVQLDKSDGMLASCAINLDNTSLAWRALMTDRLTTVDTAKMDEVCRALATAIDC